MNAPGILPNFEEGERIVLGASLVNSETATAAVKAFSPDDFYRDENRLVFRVIRDLLRQNQPLDQLIVIEHLRRANQLEKAGGAVYVAGLTEGIPFRGVNVEAYVPMLRRRTAQRRIIKLGETLKNVAWQEDADLGEIVRDAQEALSGTETSESQQVDPWTPRMFTLKDALLPLPPVEPIVQGLIDRPSLTCVYSPPGCHKTNYCLDLGVCVAAGIRHLGPLPHVQSRCPSFETSQCGVMVTDFDNGTRRMHERVAAFAVGHQVRDDIPLICVSMPAPWLVASDWACMEALGERIIRHRIGLLIVDNLLVTSGAANENDPEMALIMANWRRLTEWTNIGTILVHHPNKRETVNRPGDRLRGHGSIEAALDLALFIEREEQSNTITVKATKVRGAEINPFSAMFTYQQKPRSTELESARFYGTEME